MAAILSWLLQYESSEGKILVSRFECVLSSDNRSTKEKPWQQNESNMNATMEADCIKTKSHFQTVYLAYILLLV
jgi:hypothetical protein